MMTKRILKNQMVTRSNRSTTSSTLDYHDPSRKGGSIQTFTGNIFFPLDPRLEDIDLEDVAHGLSNKARFTGHTYRLYSTAEHNVRVSWCVRDILGGSLMEQYVATHHDDSDSFLPDVPTPLKRLPEFAWFREIENITQGLCFDKFGCVVKDYSIIKRADIILLLTEKRDLMPKRNSNWNHGYQEVPIPKPYKIKPWSPKKAKKMFLERHHELRSLLGLDK